jgi:hypothetical protein
MIIGTMLTLHFLVNPSPNPKRKIDINTTSRLTLQADILASIYLE